MLSRRLLLVGFVVLLATPSFVQAATATQDDFDFRKETYVNKKGDRLLYRLFVPLGYDRERKYPLLLWLHSGDGRGSDNVRQLTHENQLATHFWISKDIQLTTPMFLMVPQCPMGENWAEPELNQPGRALQLTIEALAKIRAEFPIDPDRIYIGGQAMGGLGVWSALQKFPGEWAGALVMSAYDNFTDVAAIAAVPVWVFQGDADDSVPVSMVRTMMQQLKKANGKVRYTEYRKGDHQVWKRAYADPELAPWLLSQRRGSPGGQETGAGD